MFPERSLCSRRSRTTDQPQYLRFVHVRACNHPTTLILFGIVNNSRWSVLGPRPAKVAVHARACV